MIQQAPPSGRTTLHLKRRFAAPREAVYRAFTDPQRLRRWFMPPGGSCPGAELDVRPGGAYRLAMKTPVGWTSWLVGVYLEVTPPERLVYTLAWEGLPIDPGSSRVTVEFHDHGESTEVRLTQVALRNRASRGFHHWGWYSSFRRLARELARAGAPID